MLSLETSGAGCDGDGRKVIPSLEKNLKGGREVRAGTLLLNNGSINLNFP